MKIFDGLGGLSILVRLIPLRNKLSHWGMGWGSGVNEHQERERKSMPWLAMSPRPAPASRSSGGGGLKRTVQDHLQEEEWSVSWGRSGVAPATGRPRRRRCRRASSSKKPPPPACLWKCPAPPLAACWSALGTAPACLRPALWALRPASGSQCAGAVSGPTKPLNPSVHTPAM